MIFLSRSLYSVRSAWTMSPAHPCIKCFFFLNVNQWIDVRPYIWGRLCLKEPWFLRIRQSFRSRRIHWKLLWNKRTRPKQCWINLSGQNIVSKHDPTLPVKGRFYGVRGAATLNGSCPSAKTMALKSGMTLTTWVVHYRHTFLKFPTIFWDLFQSSTWPRA